MPFKLLAIGLFISQLCSTNSAQSTTASSYYPSDDYTNDYQYPRSKYYYFFTPRTQARDLLQSDSYAEDRGHESYEGHEAQWPSHKVVHTPPIHVHHQPAPYHKEKHEHSYLLPILLLALLPFFLGALILLPLLFSFFTNILQLLALIQQNINNMGQNNNVGGRKKRNLLNVNPILTTTITSLVSKFIDAQRKFNDK